MSAEYVGSGARCGLLSGSETCGYDVPVTVPDGGGRGAVSG